MPKTAENLLRWLPEAMHYELQEKGVTAGDPQQLEWWIGWLGAHQSFAFKGQRGHLTLLKEARKRGSDYWYAYRSLQGRTVKEYAGRSRELTPEHLESLAETIAQKSLGKSSATHSGSGIAFSSQPILDSKLNPPRLYDAAIHRARLLAQIETGLASKLTLISAPAGFGKTTLVNQWLVEHRKSNEQIAWVSLDNTDNDPISFWRYLILSSGLLDNPRLNSTLTPYFEALESSFEPLPLQSLLVLFLNALSQWNKKIIFVLEDYHYITNLAIHEALNFFLDHLPSNIHLIMSTRYEPPLALSRLRVNGDLNEINAADLRFNTEEMTAFFHKEVSTFATNESLAQLGGQTEGWPAGLRLLALAAARQSRQVAVSASSWSENYRPLQDYFITEVLVSQPEAAQKFILQTAILDRLSVSLCNILTDRRDSEQLLETMSKNGMFLESSGGLEAWYRYHSLFASAMRAEAARRFGVEAIQSLLLKASGWYEQHGLFSDAVEVALQAQNMERAIRLIEEAIETSFIRERYEPNKLCRWFEHIPVTMLAQRPALCFSFAEAMLFVRILDQHVPLPFDLQKLEDMLQLAEAGWQDNKTRLGEVFAFHAMIYRQQGEMQKAASYAEQSIQWLTPDNILWRNMSLSILAMIRLAEGQVETAYQIIRGVPTLSNLLGQRHGLVRANTVMLSQICLEQGKLHQAAQSYQFLLAEAREQNDHDDLCDALIGLAQLSYEWNDLTLASAQAHEALRLVQDLGNVELEVQAALILARIDLAQGDADKATHACQALLTQLAANMPAGFPLRDRLVRQVNETSVRIALATGDLAAVESWAAARPDNNDPLSYLQYVREELLAARLTLLTGDAAELISRLSDLLADAQQVRSTRFTIEISLLLALAYAALDQHGNAAEMIVIALTLAQPEGYLRLFLDFGSALYQLLRDSLPGLQKDGFPVFYLRRLLVAFPDGHDDTPGAVTQQLSQQEQRVLRLLATGSSNPEIANELVVSVNTVKAHIQSIYRKLNVHNRVEASEAAHLLQLL